MRLSKFDFNNLIERINPAVDFCALVSWWDDCGVAHNDVEISSVEDWEAIRLHCAAVVINHLIFNGAICIM